MTYKAKRLSVNKIDEITTVRINFKSNGKIIPLLIQVPLSGSERENIK